MLTRLAVLLCFSFPAVAFAQETVRAPSILERAVALILPFVGAVLLAAASALAVRANRWFQTKTANEELRAVFERLTLAARDAVAYVDANTKASQLAIAADGQVTPQEARLLQQQALDKAKEFLGAQGLALAGEVFELGEQAVEAWLRGRIQTVFQLKKLEENKVAALEAGIPVPISP